MFDRLSEITLALARKGGGGSTNYNDLEHKPKINNVELAGSLSLSDLGVQGELTNGTGINITGSTISVDADSAPTQNSQKPVTSGGIKTAIDASQNTSLQMLDSTVGWTGKNMFQYPSNIVTPYTHKGVTFVYDRNMGTITVNGTNDGTGNSNFGALEIDVFTFDFSGDVIVSSEISSEYGKVILYDRTADTSVATVTNGQQQTVTVTSGHNYNLLCQIPKNTPLVTDATFKPMIRYASISDSTFEPYHDSVENVLQDAEVTPSKNLIPFPYYEDSLIRDGVTFTVNSDGSVTLQTDSNGATANTILYLMYNSTLLNDKAVHCLISKSKTELVEESGVEILYSIRNADSSQKTNIRGNSFEVTKANSPHSADGETLRLLIRVLSGKVITTPITVYPLICDPSESDPTYKPYYVPLKDVVPTKANNSALAPIENGTTASQAIYVNDRFMRNNELFTALNNIAQNASITEDSNCVKSTWADVLFDKGYINSTDNLDNVKTAGIYYINSSPTNAPEGINYCVLIVKPNKAVSPTFVEQIIFKDAIYTRRYSGSTPTWGNWFKFTGTEIVPTP